MTDTAQLSGAAETDPNAQLANAADAFKAFTNPAPAQPRDDTGKFASTAVETPEAEETELEAPEAEGEVDTGEETEEDEAAEQAQPLPPSWGAEDEETIGWRERAASKPVPPFSNATSEGFTPMTKVTNAVASYDVTTNREDLADQVYRISPADTPFMNAVPRVKATAVLHEWSLDALDAVNTTNARLEGDALTRAASTTPVRKQNYCQISSRDATVTGTQKALNPAGIDDMMSFQMSKKSLVLRKDMEAILLGNTGRLRATPRLRARCVRSMRGSRPTARAAPTARIRPRRRRRQRTAPRATFAR
jgi:hypothetical protein